MAVGNPTVGLSAHAGQVDVRITAKAASQAEAEQLIASLEAELRARLGSVIYAEGTATLEEVVAGLLAERGLTLALVDQVTGGEVAERLRDSSQAQVLVGVEPAGSVERGGWSVEREGEPAETDLAGQGPAATAAHLAARVRAEAGASLGLAVYAPPRPGFGVSSAEREAERPLTYLALDTGGPASARSYQFGGDSQLTRRWLSTRALDLVRRYLIGAPDEEIG
jgi:nicotinamide-nucleotide amidase